MRGYSAVLDELDGGLAVEGKLELVAEFKDEVLLEAPVAVEILLDGPGDISICLCD